MITGIAHCAYMVKDMNASLRFYCEQLGFKHAFSIPRDDGSPWIEYVKVTDGQFLEFFYPGPDYEARKGSYLHLCLEVDDIHATAEGIEKAGVFVRVKPQQGKDGNWQCWADDPDGNPIEFMQMDLDSLQNRS